ncbi:MAG: stage III sporulation protein AB [Clostridia bacterium]|nr:stage III sporulation protein AB [Clostridia bacterium]
MIRLAVGATLMAVVTYIGMGIDRFYKMRVEYLKGFADFLSYASREAGFLKTDILRIISLYCASESSNLTKFLKETAKKLESGEQPAIDCVYLTKKDKRLYESFFQGLINADYRTQEKLFSHHIAEISELLKEAENNKKNKGELIRKLMALGGVALMVIVI